MKTNAVLRVLLSAFLALATTDCSLSRTSRVATNDTVTVDTTTNQIGFDGLEAVREIEYRYMGSSLPPAFHRSYTITITPGAARVVIIDGYSDVLADEKYAITEQAFDRVRNALETHAIRNCPSAEARPCPGGTSVGISCSDGDTELFSGTRHYCGREDSGTLCGDVAGFAAAVKAVVPDFEGLLESTRPESSRSG